jgi:hypothetical protein
LVQKNETKKKLHLVWIGLSFVRAMIDVHQKHFEVETVSSKLSEQNMTAEFVRAGRLIFKDFKSAIE